jgi:hypothetical protein
MRIHIYLGVVFAALIVLAVAGWIATGLKKIASPAPRPRFA